MKSQRDYLLDMLTYTDKISGFTRAGQDAFLSDEKTQFAVIRAFEVIGELAKRLPPELLDQQPEAEWREIKGFRDFLAHNYEEVIPVIVWRAVLKLPVLSASILTLLDMLPPEPGQEP